MKLDVIRIGNSRGVRLPKAVLEQAGVGDSVLLTVEDERIVLTPTRKRAKPRENWAERFREAPNAPPEIFFPASTSSFDDEDWRW